jgi:hypothetical protein
MVSMRQPLFVLDRFGAGPRYFFYPFALLAWLLIWLASFAPRPIAAVAAIGFGSASITEALRGMRLAPCQLSEGDLELWRRASHHHLALFSGGYGAIVVNSSPDALTVRLT